MKLNAALKHQIMLVSRVHTRTLQVGRILCQTFCI